MRTLVVTLLLAAAVQGCATTGSAGTVTVLAPWTGAEAEAFGKVLDAFESAERVEVDYVGTKALAQVLRSEVQQGTPPDVAVLPSPGELAAYARDGYLRPLDGVADLPEDQYGAQWRRLVEVGTGSPYAVVVKADLKSMVWYLPDRLAAVPATGDELLAHTRAEVAAGRTPWCLGMAAAPDSGWPGTDWVEDVLLHQAGPDVYRSWAAGREAWTSPAVRQAWATWGDLLAGAVRGGTTSALLTDYGDAGRPMSREPAECVLNHQASFAGGGHPGDADFFPFPTFGAPPAAEVSADLAAMVNDTPQARLLLRFLASPQAQAIWPREGGAHSVNRLVDRSTGYRGEVSRRVAETLTSDEALCFDASDLMPAAMRTAFYRAALEYLHDPGSLDAVLADLDRVRAGVAAQEWLDLPCGRG